MNIIQFSELVVFYGMITCKYKDYHDSGFLFFELRPVITPSNDLIAIALSTLCGRGNYSQIKYDFKISEKAKMDIEFFCQSEVIADIKNEIPIDGNKKRVTNALSFSGGFDSLAAKYLMPNDTVLVSMDLGGRFTREIEFFQKFDTHIVRSNLLETHLRKNSWSFMGIAAILYSDYLGIKHHTFGGILEASVNNFSNNPVAAKNITFPPFAAANMINAPYTLGVTEIGTAQVLLHSAPELIVASLNSLANNGETKKYRKQLIVDLVSKRQGIDFKLEVFDTPNNKWKFGESFADDFLVFYFLKYADQSAVDKMFCNVPDEIITCVKDLELTFFERINTNFIENFPRELLGGFLNKASNYGLTPYTENDWKEFAIIRDVLRQYYKI